MDAEDGGGVGDVLLMTSERLLDIEFLEFAERFVEKDMAFEHFVHQGFEAIVNQSSFPVSSLYASRYRAVVAAAISLGISGAGGFLSQSSVSR